MEQSVLVMYLIQPVFFFKSHHLKTAYFQFYLQVIPSQMGSDDEERVTLSGSLARSLN